MREIRLSGSTSGRWKRSTVRTVGHRQTKGPATVKPHLNHRATSRLYSLQNFSGGPKGAGRPLHFPQGAQRERKESSFPPPHEGKE